MCAATIIFTSICSMYAASIVTPPTLDINLQYVCDNDDPPTGANLQYVCSNGRLDVDLQYVCSIDRISPVSIMNSPSCLLDLQCTY